VLNFHFSAVVHACPVMKNLLIITSLGLISRYAAMLLSCSSGNKLTILLVLLNKLSTDTKYILVTVVVAMVLGMINILHARGMSVKG
jgi:hypothetical protein